MVDRILILTIALCVDADAIDEREIEYDAIQEGEEYRLIGKLAGVPGDRIKLMQPYYKLGDEVVRIYCKTEDKEQARKLALEYFVSIEERKLQLLKESLE